MSDKPIRFPSQPADANDVGERAAAWLAREDRGLTADEAREFEQWRAKSPRHAEEYDRLASAWKDFDLAGSDPELVAMARVVEQRTRPRRAPRGLYWTAGLAAAAALTFATVVWWRSTADTRLSSGASSASSYEVVPGNAHQIALSDGSIVTLRGDSVVEENFTPAERHVRLVRGEAHFAVVHNSARPFIVSANGVAVRAVGTAFDVRIDPASVEVLVTEGKVRINDAAKGESLLAPTSPSEPAVLAAGQRAVVKSAAAFPPVAPAHVSSASTDEIEQALSWQSPRVVFDRTRLDEAVRVFNQNGSSKLMLGEASIGERQFGGSFRTDNAEAFVRLLELSADIRSERRADGTIVLWSRR
jgi:transmembrane sensor